MFLYMQFWEYILRFDWITLYFLPYPDTKLLVLPLVLFLLCLFGIFLQQEVKARPIAGLRRIGFALATLGLIAAILSTLNEYWLDRLLGESRPGFIPHWSGLLHDWDRATSTGLALTGIGMALFAGASIRARALPVRSVILFIFAPLFILLARTAINVLPDAYDDGYQRHLLLEGGVLAGLMLLFGAAWAIAGYYLVRTQASVQTPDPELTQEGGIE
jgi:hypothetical protein